MGNFGLCFLAYGDEHIDEFNVISNELLLANPNLHIFVLTNEISKISTNVNIVECFDEFNFNLKRIALLEAFKHFDTVVMLDTDVKIPNNSFSFLSDVENDGMYVKWIDPKLTHKGERLDIHNNEYCIELSKLNRHPNPIQFIPEYFVVLKITNQDKRIDFVNRWGEIHNSIKQFEPTDRHYNLNGAIEGCIMYLACMDLDLPVIQYGNKMDVVHYASHPNFNKRLI